MRDGVIAEFKSQRGLELFLSEDGGQHTDAQQEGGELFHKKRVIYR